MRRPALDGALLHVVHARQKAAERHRHHRPYERPQGVGDEVVHVEQPVRMRVDAKESRHLRDLEEER